MSTNRKIDIRNVGWPVCLLNCNNELNRMKEGEQMEVLVRDVDVVNNLVALVEQLPGLQVEQFSEDTHHKLIIKKGSINRS